MVTTETTVWIFGDHVSQEMEVVLNLRGEDRCYNAIFTGQFFDKSISLKKM